MDTSILSAKDRQKFEELLDRFDRALKECRDGKLPDVDAYLEGVEGKERDYLVRELQAIREDLLRGEYIKLRRIGGGGMGDVFLARHIILGREFALKEIKVECLQQGDRTEFEKRFKREIEACGRLEHHPNLVSVTNTGTTATGVPYLVMEYIDGEDLKQIVERHGALGIGYAAKIVHDAAIGLAHAHDMGLVHRDIKPSNLMISKHGVVTVLDLGLARVIGSDRQLTIVSVPGLVGSFDYMSPEQCREEKDVDARADVYSLGCTLYYLLSGQPPFAGENSLFKKLNAHQQSPVPPIQRLMDYPELWKILERMLAKEPQDRYPNLRLVARDLRPFTSGIALQSLVKSQRPSAIDTTDDSGSTVPYPLANETMMLVGNRAEMGGGGSTSVTRAAGGSASGTLAGDWTTTANGSAGRGATGSVGSTGSLTRRRRMTRRTFLRVAGVAAVAGAGTGVAMYAWPPSIDPTLANFIGTLPGLNGRWWFEEVPWLLPDVRFHLVRSLSAAGRDVRSELSALSMSPDTPKFYHRLKQWTQEFGERDGWPAATVNRVSILQDIDLEKLGDRGIVKALQELEVQMDDLPADRLSAPEIHTRAVIHHYLSRFDQAARSYDAAMQQYEKRTHGGLRALCLSDWGEMLSKQGKPELSYERFRRAWEDLTKSSPPDAEPPELFHLNCLCREADGHRAFENWDPAHACMTEALAIADRLGERQPDHPMRALFYERSGWYHVDVWRINEAEADFRKALKIRTANYEQNNLLALHFVYRNRQGRAMADYFQGNASQGGAVLKTILEEINTKDIPRKQLDELKSRRPNLLERVADAALADPEGGDDPIKYLREAIRIAQGKPDDFRRDGRRTTLARLIYKAAVATAMLGSRSDAATLREQGDEEVKAFAARQQELAQKAGRIPTENVPAVRPVYEMAQELATACVTLVDTDPRVRDKGREDLLRQFEKNPNEIGRDDLLLLLFVGEQVLRGDAFDKKLKNLVAKYLEKMAEIKPKRGPIGGSLMDRSGEGPKLFQRYLRLAMEYPRTA